LVHTVRNGVARKRRPRIFILEGEKTNRFIGMNWLNNLQEDLGRCRSIRRGGSLKRVQLYRRRRRQTSGSSLAPIVNWRKRLNPFPDEVPAKLAIEKKRKKGAEKER